MRAVVCAFSLVFGALVTLAQAAGVTALPQTVSPYSRAAFGFFKPTGALSSWGGDISIRGRTRPAECTTGTSSAWGRPRAVSACIDSSASRPRREALCTPILKPNPDNFSEVGGRHEL